MLVLVNLHQCTTQVHTQSLSKSIPSVTPVPPMHCSGTDGLLPRTRQTLVHETPLCETQPPLCTTGEMHTYIHTFNLSNVTHPCTLGRLMHEYFLWHSTD